MGKHWFIIIFLHLVFSGSVFGQLKQEYRFQFPGWKQVKPTQICSLLDLVIVLQDTQIKLKKGAHSASAVFFAGEIPSPQLKDVTGSPKPKDVAQMMIKGLHLFFENEGITEPIPPLPGRKIYPADVLVYASIAFDTLGTHLQNQGVNQIGDFSLLRFRYPKRLSPGD